MLILSILKFFIRFVKKWWIFLFTSLVVLASTWPVLHPSFFRVHDFTQAARLGEMYRSLKDGQFPVRWSENFGFGYGMPLFNFYGPLPYYIASVPMFLGISAVSSLKLFLVLLNLWSFMGAFKFGKKLFGLTGGLVVATVFVMFPYRAVDMYARGAWNELSAISFFPWVLYTILLICEQPKWKYVAGMSLGLFGVFCSHNLMTLMFLPVAYSWSLFLLLKAKKKKNVFINLHAGFILGVGLAAFYLLPAFLEKGYTKVDATILGGYFDFHNHFLYIRQWFFGKWGWGGSTYGPDDGLSFSLGVVTILISGLGAVGWYLRQPKTRNILFFFIASTLIALFFTIEKSSWFWERVPLMDYFQFPWRFLSLVALFVAVLAGGVVFWIRQKPLRVIISGICCLIMIASQVGHFRPESFLPMSVAEYDARERLFPGSVARELVDEKTGSFDLSLGGYYSDPHRIRSIVSFTLPDYIPTSVENLPKPNVDSIFIFSETKDISIQMKKNTSIEKIAQVSFPQSGSLVWKVNAFPGWTAFVDGKSVIPQITKEGWQQLSVTQGDHLVKIAFSDTPIRRFANIMSFVSLGVLVGVMFHARRSRN